MPAFIQGILIAFLEPVLHGGSNIIDHFLSSRILPRLTTLIFFGSAISINFTFIVVFSFAPPHLLSIPLLGVAFVIALIEIGYLYPYYWSLQEIDTSIVASLFSLGKIILPLLAFLLLGEHLQAMQYVGFFIIICSSAILSFDVHKVRLNKAFFLMLCVSLILALEAILYKYAFLHGADWGSFIIALAVFRFLIISFLFLISGAFRTVNDAFKRVRSVGWLFIANEIIGWGGNIGESLALNLLPVTTARAIGSTQSLFVLLYAYLLKNKKPELFREELATKNLVKKSSFFILTIVGIVLIVAFGSGDN